MSKPLTSTNEKKSRSRNDAMDDNKEKSKSKKQKTECTNLEHHVKETTIGCFEEKIIST